jgi:hypothetical protein
MKNIESQNKTILQMLLDGEKVTPLDALNRCGCFRLSARIFDLRAKGYDIRTDIVEVNGSRVAQYWLCTI